MQDTIEREITVRASQERVFHAIADPKQIVAWFPETLEGELKEGQQPIFGFGEDGRASVYVVKIQPFDYFAYRWVPAAGEASVVENVLAQANTLVEFRLREENGMTVVKLTETGFASLPGDAGTTMFPQNSSGWDYMLNRLQEHLQTLQEK